MTDNKRKSGDTSKSGEAGGSTKPRTSKSSTTEAPVNIAVIEPGQKK